MRSSMCSIDHDATGELEKFPDLDTAFPESHVNSIDEVHTSNAGLNTLDHYRRKLPQWRYNLRQKLLPLIRWETPYLAWMQDKTRCPALDTYFAIIANLGTHTFFMTALPVLFWCGQTHTGRGLAHVIMTGVFLTGFLKDMLSLPRPLSPPLHRINMSGSAALEYGFPSTHSANAVSVAVYCLYLLASNTTLSPLAKSMLQATAYCYMFSITLGRLYCGMHGFLDVIVGSVIGAAIAVVECTYGTAFENYLHHGTFFGPATFAMVVFTSVRIHPEPADDCPCFDDSVAVAGVMVGVEIGGWHYSSTKWSWSLPFTATVPFDLAHLGWPKVILRVVVGVVVVFAWREVMKPFLLRTLPYLFRIIERQGLSLPRKYFIQASEYSKIPARLRVDNVMPSVSDLPSLITSIRHPSRGRSVSIGPQSAADAYETLAYRHKRRKSSLAAEAVPQSSKQCDGSGTDEVTARVIRLPQLQRAPSTYSTYEQMMGQGRLVSDSSSSRMPSVVISSPTEHGYDGESAIIHDEEMDEKEIFSRLETPRRRYDVEVVTKLVVYTGIAWLAVEGNPIIFEYIGLGMTSFPPRMS